MWNLAFNDSAAKAFKKLDGQTQRSIKAKLLEIQALEDPAILMVDVGPRDSIYD